MLRRVAKDRAYSDIGQELIYMTAAVLLAAVG